jgi:hypothetical protein
MSKKNKSALVKLIANPGAGNAADAAKNRLSRSSSQVLSLPLNLHFCWNTQPCI